MPVTVEDGWLKGDLDGIRVEKRESRRPSGQPYIPLDNPKAFIIHTTEGTTVDGAWNTLNSRFSAPHFIAGEGRIVQMRPLWAEGATVHDHNNLGWQVECVGFSKQFQHKLTLPSWRPLVALTRFMAQEKNVPLRRPDGWKDDCSDINTALATDNTRRKSRKALFFSGLLGHIDIPDQAPTWHWDPGCLDYSALIEEVGEVADERLDQMRDGARAYWAGVTMNPDWPLFKQFGYNLAERGEEHPKPTAHTHAGLAPANHTHPASDHSHTGTVEVS